LRGDRFLYTPRPFSVENLPQLSPIIPTLAQPPSKSNHCYHLRDTQGEGGAFSMTPSPRAPRHSFTLSRTQGPPSSLFPLHTKSSPVTPLFPLLTQKRGSTPPSKMSARRHFWFFPIFFAVFAGPGGWRIQFAITSWVATSLARAKKLRYAGSVASGGFPPHSLSVVPLAIQFPVNEG
jgi:hypothetical protein